MRVIILEALYLAAVVTAIVALAAGIFGSSPWGVRWRQARNRRAAEHSLGLECATHGRFEEPDLVRLPTGERMCPQCYKETV